MVLAVGCCTKLLWLWALSSITASLEMLSPCCRSQPELCKMLQVWIWFIGYQVLLGQASLEKLQKLHSYSLGELRMSLGKPGCWRAVPFIHYTKLFSYLQHKVGSFWRSGIFLRGITEMLQPTSMPEGVQGCQVGSGMERMLPTDKVPTNRHELHLQPSRCHEARGFVGLHPVWGGMSTGFQTHQLAKSSPAWTCCQPLLLLLAEGKAWGMLAASPPAHTTHAACSSTAPSHSAALHRSARELSSLRKKVWAGSYPRQGSKSHRHAATPPGHLCSPAASAIIWTERAKSVEKFPPCLLKNPQYFLWVIKHTALLSDDFGLTKVFAAGIFYSFSRLPWQPGYRSASE